MLYNDSRGGQGVHSKSHACINENNEEITKHFVNAKGILSSKNGMNEALCRILEPNISTTKERFETIKILCDNGIPTVLWLSPLLPFINIIPNMSIKDQSALTGRIPDNKVQRELFRQSMLLKGYLFVCVLCEMLYYSIYLTYWMIKRFAF